MTFKPYPKYKDSGVGWLGEIPITWKCLSGKRIFSQIRDASCAEDEQLSATQKYGVVPQKMFMELEDQKVMLALAGLGNFKQVKKNDFVISLRSFQGGIERSMYDGCVSPAYTVLRSNRDFDSGYWAFVLKSEPYISALQSVTDGIRDGKNISYEQFGMICLPLPSISEQSAIAAFLDRETAKIDALVAEQERLIELLKEKRQAVISHAVTKGLNPKAPMKPSGIDWLGDVPEHWEVLSVRRVSKNVLTGGTPSTEMLDEDVEEGVVWYTPGDFSNSLYLGDSARKISKLAITSGEAKIFPENSVLIVSIGATLGRVGYSRRMSSANQQINAIVPNKKIEGYFLAYSLSAKSEVMKYLSNASTIGIMNQEKTKDIFLVVPSLNEQSDIAHFLDCETTKIDLLVEEANAAISLLQERRTALISAAVTGKIDVRDLLKNKKQDAA